MIDKIKNFVFYTVTLLFAITGLIAAFEKEYILGCLSLLVSLSFLGILLLMFIYEELKKLNDSDGKKKK